MSRADAIIHSLRDGWLKLKESKESLNNVHHKNQPRLHFIFDHVIALHIIIEEIQTFIEYELLSE